MVKMLKLDYNRSYSLNDLLKIFELSNKLIINGELEILDFCLNLNNLIHIKSQ